LNSEIPQEEKDSNKEFITKIKPLFHDKFDIELSFQEEDPTQVLEIDKHAIMFT
jgi:hypothetical protein